MSYIIPDLDLDMSAETNDVILKTLHHIPASKINDKGIFPHGVGNYFMDIPVDRVSELASIDYKIAEEKFGYIKVDFLHNTVYDRFKNRQELLDIVDTEPDWSLLYKKTVIERLPHISNYYTLINQLPKIDSIEKLAMFIAIIRPAKKYLIPILEKEGWKGIEKDIWKKEDEGYQFKKSHAIAFAIMIKVALLSLDKEQDENIYIQTV